MALNEFNLTDLQEIKDERRANIFMRALSRKKKNQTLSSQKLRKQVIREEKLKKLRAQGLSQGEIGKILGITRQAVSYAEIRLGIHRQMFAAIKHVVYCRACGRGRRVSNSTFLTRKNWHCSRTCVSLFKAQVKATMIEKNKNFCHICKKTFDYKLITLGGHRHICRGCNSERARVYRKSPRGQLIYKQIRLKQLKENPEKVRARIKLNMALKSGKVKKPKKCQICHKEKKLDGHHPDYSKPLKVKWYCRVCHLTYHRKLRESKK